MRKGLAAILRLRIAARPSPCRVPIGGWPEDVVLLYFQHNEMSELCIGVKAEQLSLPVHGEQIVVHGGGNSLDVAVNYDVDIEIPLIEREIFKKTFEHQVRYRGPR